MIREGMVFRSVVACRFERNSAGMLQASWMDFKYGCFMAKWELEKLHLIKEMCQDVGCSR